MIFDCGRRLRRIEDKLDRALQMLRLSEKREGVMGDLLDVLVGKVNELHDQVDVNTAEIAEAIELLKEAQDDPAKIQEAIDKLQDTSDALKASDAALQSALPVEPTPEPEPEPTQG